MATSHLWRLAARSSIPLTASYLYQPKTACEEPGMNPTAEGDFHGLFPQRQLWVPKQPYPLWDTNWDGKEPPSTGDAEQDRQRARHIRKQGVTRHIILIRHGQYDESFKVNKSCCADSSM